MDFTRKNALGFLAQGDFGAARSLFQRMLDESEADSEMRIEALLGLGLCDRSQNRLNSAVEHFERSLSLRPSLAAVENLLSLYRELGDEGRRQAAARRALEMSFLPADQRARFVMIAGNA
jgi:tetratricopeptide (TPR) repeat protein